MKIAFSNHKGGTGKTTSTINLGVALSQNNKKVLLVDLDPQGNLSYSLGLNNVPFTVVDCMLSNATFEQTAYEIGNLIVLPANISLNDKESLLQNKTNLLGDFFKKLNNYNFDYILMDCPPTATLYTQNALSCANSVIIPILMEVLSIKGMDQILSRIKIIQKTTNPNLKILGVLGVAVNEGRKLTKEIEDFISETYPELKLFDTKIRNSVKAAEAPSFALSLIEYAPDSTSAKDYLQFSQELLNGL